MKSMWVKMIAAVIVALTFQASPAMAQATRTWVSGVGDDANPCSRTAPCKTFAGAISKTAASGEISVLDPGGYGGVTIVKPITLRSDGQLASLLVSGTNGITININPATYPNARVVLEGLEIEGLGNGTSLDGVHVVSARDVIVTDVAIRGFNSANSAAVKVDATGKARVTIFNSRLIGNTNGVVLISADGQASAKIATTLFANNTNAGVSVSGTGNTASVSDNEFYGSPKALEILSGGTVTSYGNNTFGTTATDTPTLVPRG